MSNLKETERFRDAARCVMRDKHWRWMPGMVTTNTPTGSGGIVVSVKPGVVTVYERGLLRLLGENELPDLTEPSTEGCLMELVRLACGAPHASLYTLMGDVWEMEGFDFVYSSKHRWEVLVAALEGATWHGVGGK